MNRGGTRPNAGRKLGSGKGRTAVTMSISLPPVAATELRKRSAGEPLGKWLIRKLKLPTRESAAQKPAIQAAKEG